MLFDTALLIVGQVFDVGLIPLIKVSDEYDYLKQFVLGFCFRFYLTLSCKYVYLDGSLHNLNEYMEIRAADVLTDLPPELTSAVFGQKHGVVIGEAHLEELFSQIP